MSIKPEESMGYWLFYAQRTIAYAFTEVLKQCCLEHNKPYVITPPQWGGLSLLYETDGLTISTISQRRGIDAPTVTGIVSRMEQNGLVERRHDRIDRRVVRVYLTDEGREAYEFLISAAEDFNATLTRSMSEAEQRDLLLKLQRLIANAATVAPGTGDRFGLLPHNLLSSSPEQVTSQSADPITQG